MIQRYGTQVSPNGDTLVYHEHGSWVKYTDHTEAIQELREALEWTLKALEGLSVCVPAIKAEPMMARARATLDKYKGE